jgi:hypothetical protein
MTIRIERDVRRALFMAYRLIGSATARLFGGGHSMNIYYTLIYSKARAFPDKYSKHDLLIESGARLPYFVSHWIAPLYRTKWPVEMLWTMAGVVVWFFFMASFWVLAEALTGERWIAFIALLITMTSSPYSGTLHWNPLYPVTVIPFFVAIPIVFIEIALILNGSYMTPATLSAATFYIHPSCGAIAGSLYLASIFFDLRGSMIEKGASLALFSVMMAPFAMSIIAVKKEKVVMTTDLANIFRKTLYHCFVEKHLHEGYGIFGLMLYATALLSPYYHGSLVNPKALYGVVAVLIALPVLSTINIYTIFSASVKQMSLFRATLYLKAICFTMMTFGAFRFAQSAQVISDGSLALPVFYISCALYFLAAGVATQLATSEGHRDLITSEFMALAGAVLMSVAVLGSKDAFVQSLVSTGLSLVLAYLMVKCLEKSSGGNLVVVKYLTSGGNDGRIDKLRALNAFNFFFGIIGVALVIARYWASGRYSTGIVVNNHLSPDSETLIALVTIFTVLIVTRRFIALGKTGTYMERLNAIMFPERKTTVAPPLYEATALSLWAKTETPNGSMFIVDPGDQRFMAFRYFAERSIWIFHYDVQALNYDPYSFKQGYARFKSLGADYIVDRGFIPSFGGYYNLSKQEWAATIENQPIDYIVFDTSRMTVFLNMPVAYEDDNFIVYKTVGNK